MESFIIGQKPDGEFVLLDVGTTYGCRRLAKQMKINEDEHDKLQVLCFDSPRVRYRWKKRIVTADEPETEPAPYTGADEDAEPVKSPKKGKKGTK